MTLRYKTKLTIEVLSEGEYGDGLTLEQIAYDISEGPCVGRLSIEKSTTLSAKEMADALVDFGSEPSFFQLDDNGELHDW